MSAFMVVRSADGFEFAAYRSDPPGDVIGGVVVAQEIFGVNSHIRQVCDDFASAGFTAIAPALFDRQKRHVELGYQQGDREQGRGFMQQADLEAAVEDMAAAAAEISDAGKVAAVGYCWGGTIAWLAAARASGFSASVCYYGPGIASHLEDKPRCPTMLHLGEHDQMIPEEAQATIREVHPDVTMHLYPAGHGFNCSQRDSWNPEAARLAFERTVEFLKTHLSGDARG